MIAHVGDYVLATSRRPRRFAIGVVREIAVFGKRFYRIGPENPNEEAFPWIYPNIRHITRAQGKKLIRAYHRKNGTPMFHQIWSFLIQEHKRKCSSSRYAPSTSKPSNVGTSELSTDPTVRDGTNGLADPGARSCSATDTAPGADSEAESE